MPRIQQKIMGALTALVLFVVGITAVLAEQQLRDRRNDELIETLESRTRLVAAMARPIEMAPVPNAELVGFARQAGLIAKARVTLIAPDGRVLADSALSLDEVRELERHDARPEVIAARHQGLGRAQRRSGTLKRQMIYMAVPVASEDSVVVVRLARDLHPVDAAVADLRKDLVRAGLLGLVAALGLSYLLARVSGAPIQELGRAVSDIAEGRLNRPLHLESGLDEHGEIARAINRMARQLRDQASQATREKDQLEAVLGAMAEGVLVVDTDNRVLLANPPIREMFDLWGSVEGRLVAEVVRSFEVNSILDETRARDEIVVGEVDLLLPRERTLMVHAGRFPKEGERLGTVAVLHDVTELRRVDRVRSDFIANASHELRTPLTAIRGFADTLVGSNLQGAELQPYLEVIARNSQRMSDLIDDLLQLSRIESGRATMEASQIDLVRTCELMLRDLGPRLEEAGLESQLHCTQPKMSCWMDRQALEQVITNLLTNAVRYTNAGGRIDVHLVPDDEWIEIAVSDTGIGIPEADLERIFERFYRVDAARSRVIGSTGLGLSIVKHLTRSMGGDVRVESQLGEGTTFTIRLPLSHQKSESRTPTGASEPADSA